MPRMLWVISCVLLALLMTYWVGPVRFQFEPAAVQQRQSQMLNPTVRIEMTQGSGSGTVIHSSERGTFIITNHHVGGETGNTVQARFWILNHKGETVLSILRDAKVVAHDADADLSLLRLADTEFRAESIATLAPEATALQPTEGVFVCGSALGLRAHCTTGLLSLVETILLGRPHIAMSAPTIYGNSGGALYHMGASGRFEYIGTVRAIAMAGYGSPISTTAYAIPNASLRGFLRGNGFGDLI